MTLQEAKNLATNKVTGGEYNDFDLLVNHSSGGIVGFHILITALEITAHLYACSKWDEACEETIEEVKSIVGDEYRYEFKLPTFKP